MKILKSVPYPDGGFLRLRDHGIGCKSRYSIARVFRSGHIATVSGYSYLSDAYAAFEKFSAELHVRSE